MKENNEHDIQHQSNKIFFPSQRVVQLSLNINEVDNDDDEFIIFWL